MDHIGIRVQAQDGETAEGAEEGVPAAATAGAAVAPQQHPRGHRFDG